MTFTGHKFTGISACGNGVGVTYVLEPLGLESMDGDDSNKQEFAMLRRRKTGKSVGMRLPVEDLGLISEYSRQAFLESMGLEAKEVGPHELRMDDSIDGLGVVGSAEMVMPANKPTSSGSFALVIVTIKDTETRVTFTSSSDGKFTQLIDITRPLDDEAA